MRSALLIIFVKHLKINYMIPNEVRIGNWVLIPTNNKIKIPCFPKKIKAITLFGEFDFTEPTYPENHLVPAKNCIGIEINHDFFIRNGFKHDENQQIYNREDICISYSENYKGYKLYVNHEYETGKAFLYLHEFQNLYFALKGTELSLAAA
jgi:hypothetical protein